MNAQLHATHITAMKSGVVFSASRSALATGSHAGAGGNVGVDVDEGVDDVDVAAPPSVVVVAVVANDNNDDEEDDIVGDGR